jgi:hypothetical protein
MWESRTLIGATHTSYDISCARSPNVASAPRPPSTPKLRASDPCSGCDGSKSIWCQWCLGHLSDPLLVAFLKRAHAALRPKDDGAPAVYTHQFFVIAHTEKGEGTHLVKLESSSSRIACAPPPGRSSHTFSLTTSTLAAGAPSSFGPHSVQRTMAHQRQAYWLSRRTYARICPVAGRRR